MRHSFAYGFVMFVFVSLCVGQNTSPATGNAPLLLRQPAVSKTQIVFNYAGDLWIVARDGGDARRLTSAVGTATNPCVLSRRHMDRFYRELRGQSGCLRGGSEWRTTAAADVPSRNGSSCRVDS